MRRILRWLAGVSTAVASLLAAQADAGPAFPPPDLVFHMHDGFVLPARIWRPAPGTAPAGVILALHGFTDSRDAWEYPAPGFAAAGYTVVAPDQRGFGATSDRGTWAGQNALIGDAEDLAAQLRARFPGQRLVLMGESMGAAITMCVAASAPATADDYVLLSPAVWGRAEMAPYLRASLWAANHVAPDWTLTGNEVELDITPSDNREALLRLAHDPLTLRAATVGMLHGLVDLMDSAQAAAAHLPSHTLVLNGRRDQVVPQPAIAAAWAKLPQDVRRGFYMSGYHLLLRDLDRALVEADVLSWLAKPDAWLPSGADINAASWQADHAWAAAMPVWAADSVGRSAWPY
jgi:alpha-beta hydrolase superfamily lysophospholipase